MSKLYLKYTFDTNKPEDMYDYKALVNANKYRRSLYDLYVELRGKAKHFSYGGNNGESYDVFWDCMKDNDLDLEDLL